MAREKKKSSQTQLKIEKDFNYLNSKKISDDLRSALKKKIQTRLVLSNIISTDLSALQLIVSAIKSFEKTGNPLQVELTCSDEVKQLLENCGFGKLTEPKTVS